VHPCGPSVWYGPCQCPVHTRKENWFCCLDVLVYGQTALVAVLIPPSNEASLHQIHLGHQPTVVIGWLKAHASIVMPHFLLIYGDPHVVWDTRKRPKSTHNMRHEKARIDTITRRVMHVELSKKYTTCDT